MFFVFWLFYYRATAADKICDCSQNYKIMDNEHIFCIEPYIAHY